MTTIVKTAAKRPKSTTTPTTTPPARDQDTLVSLLPKPRKAGVKPKVHLTSATKFTSLVGEEFVELLSATPQIAAQPASHDAFAELRQKMMKGREASSDAPQAPAQGTDLFSLLKPVSGPKISRIVSQQIKQDSANVSPPRRRKQTV